MWETLSVAEGLLKKYGSRSFPCATVSESGIVPPVHAVLTTAPSRAGVLG